MDLVRVTEIQVNLFKFEQVNFLLDLKVNFT